MQDPDAILKELKDIARRENQGYIDHVQSKRKRLLMEMHKKMTFKVKHEEKKKREEPEESVAAAAAFEEEKQVPMPPKPSLLPPPPNPFFPPPPVPQYNPYALMQPYNPYPVTSIPPPAPVPAPAPVAFDSGKSEYQKSIERLRYQQRMEELHSNVAVEPPQKKQSLQKPEEDFVYANIPSEIRSQKITKTKSNAKPKKIIETDALGNVVSKKETSKKEAPKKETPKQVNQKQNSALSFLGKYGQDSSPSKKEPDDAYESLMKELNSAGAL